MSEGSQVTRSPKDPVRIVYHAGDRTFARLFNERSLDEVKDVVRRKLGLGAETDVSLKQMGSGALLDLEDDGDFQAFRVFLGSSVSVDIEVTVGKSRGHAVSPPVAPQPEEHVSASKPTTTISGTLPSMDPAGTATSGQHNTHPEAPLRAPEKTPLTRKRKVSFDRIDAVSSDESTEQRLGQSTVHPEVVHSTEAPAAPARKLMARKRPPPSYYADIAASAGLTDQHPGQPAAQPEVADGTTASTTPAKTLLTRKRKMPSDKGDATSSDKPTEQHSGRPTAHPEVASGTGASTTPAGKPVARKRKVPPDHSDNTTAPTKPTEQSPGQPIAHPEVASIAEASTTSAKKPVVRKRPVQFDYGDIASSGEPTEQPTLVQPITVTPIASATTAESPVVSKLGGAGEPPKKKRKSEPAKEVETAEIAGSPSVKPLAPKTKSKKTTTSDKVETSTSKDTETSKPPIKKQRKRKIDDTTSSKKSPPTVDQDGTNQPISQPSNLVNEAVLPPAVEKSAQSSVGGGALKTHKSEKEKAPTACSAIPQTDASVTVHSEVVAAILSSCPSKASETIPPKPPAKQRSVKRDTKKSIVSSVASPPEPMTVPDLPTKEIPNVPIEHEHEHVGSIDRPPRQTPDLDGPLCPICFGKPFHIRYYCPTVLKGPDAIRERLEELKRADMGDQQSVIKQLEALLHDPKVTFMPPLNAASTDGVQLGEALPSLSPSFSGTPNVPSNSYPSEITVESRDEGSSSESSDEVSEGEVEHRELSAPQEQRTLDEQKLLSSDDLEAIMRGPMSMQQSVLDLLDRIVGDKSDGDPGAEEDEAKLEEDPDEESGQSGRRLSRRVTRSSDSESEEEEPRSPSPSSSAKDTLNDGGPAVNSSKSVDDSARRQERDVVMRDSMDPPALEGRHGGSEETRVGSEDPMVVDESIKEREAAVVLEEQPPSPTSPPRLLDAPRNEQQEPGKAHVDLTPSQDDSVPASLEALKEADADPIEPADDLILLNGSHLPNADPIEAPSDDMSSLFTGVTQSTPKPGVSKRIKTRNGEILDNEAEQPVLLEQLASEATNKVTPMSARGKSRRKVTETPASQKPVPTRKSPRFSSVPPSTSTPVAVVLLNHRSKSGIRTGKASETPGKGFEERSDVLESSAKDDAVKNGTHIAPTSSLIRWETLADPSPPSIQPDEPSPLIDELMSSSPQPNEILVRGGLNDKKRGRPRKSAASSQADSSQGKERLFDLSSSQIPFPYSQNLTNPEPAEFSKAKENEGTTDSEEPKAAKKAKMPVRYRSLSQLASYATLFSPSFPTPVNKSVTNSKARKRVTDEDSSSSSPSSSDEDEANGSDHIPRGRRAGSALETKKSLLSRV